MIRPQPDDPFQPTSLSRPVYYVDAAAGTEKTTRAVQQAVAEARRGRKTIFAMPTKELIKEWAVDFAQDFEGMRERVFVIVSEELGQRRPLSIEERIAEHIEEVEGGHLLFITHEALFRVIAWPERTREYHLIIDEELAVVLTRSPLLLRYEHHVLTSWLERPERMPGHNSGYYRLLPAFDPTRPDDPYWKVELRANMTGTDDVFGKVVAPFARYLCEGACLFTNADNLDKMLAPAAVARNMPGSPKGQITISGFRRPDFLDAFHKVTMMSALFRHTMCYAVWSKFGVDFRPSSDIRITKQKTFLTYGRKLRIGWLVPDGWSKWRRDQIDGGIGKVLELVQSARDPDGRLLLDPNATLCVNVNKDDLERTPDIVRDAFGEKGLLLPHRVRGLNTFRTHHQLLYCSALNSFTPDIRWLEEMLGIDAAAQRIARLAQEFYQTITRTSLRDPRARADVTAICMDRDVAEFQPQWFEPADQIDVFEIPTNGLIQPRRRPGPRSAGGQAATGTERSQKSRRLAAERRRAEEAAIIREVEGRTE